MSNHDPNQQSLGAATESLAMTIHELSRMAKKADDPMVAKMLYSLKCQLCNYAIEQYSNLALHYHAHDKGPLVYVTFTLKDKKVGVHVPFNHLSGCNQYRTARLLGNPYVFNRINLSKPDRKNDNT